MKLYDIPREAEEIEQILCDCGGELTPELEERINQFMQGSQDKLEAAACVLRSLEGQAEVCNQEAERLDARCNSLKRSAARLKELMLCVVDSAFNGKVKTPRFSIWGQNAASTVHFELPPGTPTIALPAIYLRTFEPEINNKALLEDYKAGKNLPEILIVTEQPGTRYLRVK